MTDGLVQSPPDAAFVPSDPDRPLRRLTRAQVEAFNRDGLIPRLAGLDPGEAAAHRAAFDELLARAIAAGNDSYSINGWHARCRFLHDLVRHPVLTACAVDLLGDDVIAWGTHYFCKMPHDPKRVSWHQDAAYWPLAPTRTVTAWIAIDDVDEGNGAMRVIPGTHRLGVIPPRPSRPDEANVLWQSLDDVERFAEPQPIILRAGEVSWHSDLLVHGSPPNPSPRRRAGLTIRYAAASVRRTAPDWRDAAILVHGSDPSGHWTFAPRPEVDFPV